MQQTMQWEKQTSYKFKHHLKYINMIIGEIAFITQKDTQTVLAMDLQ